MTMTTMVVPWIWVHCMGGRGINAWASMYCLLGCAFSSRQKSGKWNQEWTQVYYSLTTQQLTLKANMWPLIVLNKAVIEAWCDMACTMAQQANLLLSNSGIPYGHLCVPFCAPAAPRAIQLPSEGLGKQKRMARVLVTLYACGRPKDAPGSLLQIPQL